MKTLDYDFHGWLKARISNPARFGLKDFNRKYAAFLSPGMAKADQNADLEVEVGEFTPDLKGAYSVDRKYFVKPGYVYFEDGDKRLGWKAEISGLEGPVTRVRVQYHSKNRWSWPWVLFPDMVMNLYILQPLLEYLLAGKGVFVMHAAAVAKGDAAVVMAGRGSTYKTTLATKMLDAGYSLIGDDIVFFDRERIYSCAIHRHLFRFNWKRLESEDDLGLVNRIRLFAELTSTYPDDVPITASARPCKLFLLRTRKRDGGARVAACGRDSALRKVALNNLMEETAYTSYKYKIGGFLDAYAMVYPDSRFLRMEHESKAALAALFADASFHELDMPAVWSRGHAETLVQEAAA